MGVYDRQIASAKRQIAAKGESVTWTQKTNGTPPDADIPWKPGAAQSVPHTVNIAFFPVGRSRKRSKEYSQGSVVPKGNLYGIMEAVDFEPQIKDVITRGGKEISVLWIDPLDPNGEGAIIYQLELAT